MKKFLFFYLSLQIAFGQADEAVFNQNNNEVYFLEIYYGISRNDQVSFFNGIGFNYQVENHLLTLRYNEQRNNSNHSLIGISQENFSYSTKLSHEVGLLYGKRWNEHNQSSSLSIGPAYNWVVFSGNTFQRPVTEGSLGIAFEANYKFFKAKKSSYRFYHLIPLSNPTAFGRSLGFKFSATIANYSYMGLGLTYSWGQHKVY